MSGNAIDEDGFHSIAWDDAPTQPQHRAAFTDISAGSDDGLGDGFETIVSPQSPGASTSTTNVHIGDEDGATIRDRPSRDQLGLGGGADPGDWSGRWMSIEVRDPVKEHEGSKDMFVSYAVKTKVSTRTVVMTWNAWSELMS